MNDYLLAELVDEVYAEYQIPPYTSDKVVSRAVEESAARIGSLAANVDFIADKQARELVKARAYYVLNHIADEFEPAYGHVIRAWQLGMEVTDETDEDS